MIAAVTAAMTIPAALALPAAAPAAETTIPNNLSFPAIWSEGMTLSPRGTYGAPVLQVPTEITTSTGDKLTVYLQGVEGNSWQAENTVATAPVNVSQVDWGDNIESRTLTLTSPIRVETTLIENLATPMSGFTMYSASGSKDTEQFGTDGTVYPSTQADIYSGCARLTIQRLEISRDDPYVSAIKWDPVNGQWTGTGLVAAPIFNSGVWAGGGEGGFAAEINGSGKVVYGYNWSPTGLTAGDYRVTFSLDPNCPVATLNTFMTPDTTIYTSTETETPAALLPAAGKGGGGNGGGGGSGGGGGETGGGATPQMDPTDNLTYIDVELGTPTYKPYVPPAPVNTALPAISGTTTQGQVLTASTGNWDNVPTTYTYQWQSCDSTGAGCIDVTGATTGSYLLSSADVGRTMRVVVTATNENGTASATSAATSVVAPLAPVSTSPPTILGAAQVGSSLLAINGSWGNDPTGYSYQWQICDATGTVCNDIAGANSGSYTLTSAFVGSRVRVIVTASNPGGSTVAASSPTDVITDAQITAQMRGQSRVTLHLQWLEGNRMHLWGDVTPARDGAWLNLQLRTRTGWKTVATVLLRTLSAQSSKYSVYLPRMAAGVYRAYLASDQTHLAGNSVQIRARAQAHATLRLQRSNGLLKLTGTVSPARDGRPLMIQVKTRSGWKKFATVRLRTAAHQRSQFMFSVASLKPGVYRAYYGGDVYYRAGGSGLVTVR